MYQVKMVNLRENKMEQTKITQTGVIKQLRIPKRILRRYCCWVKHIVNHKIGILKVSIFKIRIFNNRVVCPTYETHNYIN